MARVGVVQGPIHPSVRKVNTPKLVLTEFSEVALVPAEDAHRRYDQYHP
jgi:hypothetical protein